jgi:predicted N-acetyltransferase YhbS
MSQQIDERRQARVRQLAAADLESVIALDAKNTGRRREQYFKLKLAQALHDTGIQVALAAEVDGTFAGFLLARVYYGEFGTPEPVAMLDTLGVRSDLQGIGIGRTLLRQLRINLQGLGVPRLQTEVSWEDQDLLFFFHRVGFEPARRFCLDLDLDRARALDEAAEACHDG